jgi:hypothetical protein
MNFFRSKPKTPDQVYQENLSKFKSTQFVVPRLIINKYTKLGKDEQGIRTYINAFRDALNEGELSVNIDTLRQFVNNNEFLTDETIKEYKSYATILLPILEETLQFKLKQPNLEQPKLLQSNGGRKLRRSRKSKRRNRKSKKNITRQTLV